jgi:hypothetical protein
MRPLQSIRHRIAPLRSGSLSAGSAPACIFAPSRPPAPPQIRARNTQFDRPKSKSPNFIDLKPPPGPLPGNPRGTLYQHKSP